MALLNEEQINQLVKMASVTSTTTSYYENLCEWNEKQQPAAFEPDWSKAPKDATRAMLSLTWVFKEQTWALGHTIAIYDKPEPVITPHPHAEIMAKYAEVAARRPDPWVEFEFKCDGQGWTKSTMLISFYEEFNYRYIGDDK